MSDLTYNDMLNAYAAYPAPIRPYLLRAETHPLIRPQLTKLGIRVFIDLLARTPIRDTMKPIMVKVDNVAEQLSVSTKTVGRVIRLMLSFNWLSPTTTHDGRDNNGKYSWREFIVGSPLRCLLGLPTAPPEIHASATPETFSSPIATTSPAPVKDVQESTLSVAEDTEIMPSETILSNGVIGVNNAFEKEASPKEAFPQESEPITPPEKREKIPQGLTELNSVLGISARGIFKLMRLAKSKGQWLQNVWVAKGHQLLNAGALEGRAVNYFEFLLNTGEDFDYVARCKGPAPLADALSQFKSGGRPQSKNVPVEDKPPSLLDELLAIAKRSRFKHYYHISNGMRVKMYDGTAEVTRDRVCEIYAGEQMLGLYKGIANGNLREHIE